jgi:3-phytase
MNKQIIIILSISLFATCKNNSQQQGPQTTEQDSTVVPAVETTPVPSTPGEDAADDPAIWVHPEDKSQSTIIGTNKKGGLAVYNLNGEQLYYYPVGRVNNVDVCYGFPLNGQKTDLVAATNRTSNSITLMKVDSQTGALSDVADTMIKSNVQEVYGICMYASPKTNDYYVFVNGKEGAVEQWKLIPGDSNRIRASVVREFRLASQPEGMVADDETGDLYIGEENACIWKYGAEPGDGDQCTKIAMSDTSNPNIAYDIEGLTMYYAPEGKGYLIASSQGNYSFAVFKREGNNEYITSFSITDGVGIDRVEETDGIDVTAIGLGTHFPSGVFVAQDGFNYDHDTLANQNFKLVPWERIAKLLK